MLKEADYNMNELRVVHYDMDAYEVIKLHFLTYPIAAADDETMPNLVEDFNNMQL